MLVRENCPVPLVSLPQSSPLLNFSFLLAAKKSKDVIPTDAKRSGGTFCFPFSFRLPGCAVLQVYRLAPAFHCTVTVTLACVRPKLLVAYNV